MKIINFGSLNLDIVYRVPHIVAPGETISSRSVNIFPGGKGLNQSVALAKAGSHVMHAGLVGSDGGMLLDVLREAGVDTSLILPVSTGTGNAFIQVADNGQNSICLYGGANEENSPACMEEVFAAAEPGDWLLMQNEVSLPDQILAEAKKAGMKIALNPSPYNGRIAACDLTVVDLFFVNEVEAGQILGREVKAGIDEAEKAAGELREKFPGACIVMTLGGEGAVCLGSEGFSYQPPFPVKAVDTTAAGDCFTGYFLRSFAEGVGEKDCLRKAAAAAAIAVGRQGAAPSIPWEKEVTESLAE